MASQRFINECKKGANNNRLAKFTLNNEELNQTNHISSIELKDSCFDNGTIIGAVFDKTVDVSLIDMPSNTNLDGETISPSIGINFAVNDNEWINYDNYKIEKIDDTQTSKMISFTAYGAGTELDKKYECSLSFDNNTTHTIYEFYEDALDQLGLTPTDNSIDNGSIVMTGNPFTNNETIRTVLSEVEKVSCSILKIDWQNLTASLTWLSSQIDYEFTTGDYSTLEGSLTQYGPLNEVILGNEQFDGENVVEKDDESIALNGLHSIMIDAPYFLYTQDLREQAKSAIFNKLDGLTYYDLKLTALYGKPFLEIGNKIRINTTDNRVLDTYVLTHTFTFDGAFKSVIESPALTSTEQKYKNYSSPLKERVRRTEVIVDKAEGQITALTETTEQISSDLQENYFDKSQTDEFIQRAKDGLTNTFSEAGGNNIFRNTGLWFTNSGNDSQTNPYEFWYGKVARYGEENASNLSALMLQNDTLYQKQTVPDGEYTVSFKYKKLYPTAVVSCRINDVEYSLTATTDTEFSQKITVVGIKEIKVEFICDTNNACEIYDLMVNAGGVKLAYSQNQNETTTDTVNISKGITITSSDTVNTTFKANSDGIRVYNNGDLNNSVTKFTDTGLETKKAVIENTATITGTLWQDVNGHTWITRL